MRNKIIHHTHTLSKNKKCSECGISLYGKIGFLRIKFRNKFYGYSDTKICKNCLAFFLNNWVELSDYDFDLLKRKRILRSLENEKS